MLEVTDIHTYYGTSHVLFGLSLKVKECELVALLGRNGAGKTTTLRSIMGTTPPQSGSIKFQGQEISTYPPYSIARLGIGFIPDNKRIFPDLTVRDNLQIAARNRRDRGGGWTISRVYELFPALKNLEKRTGAHLSGGEQQMLAIGRALMGNPLLLLMDEPTQGLAPLLVRHLGEQVMKLTEEGVAVLLSEQNVAFTSWVSERAYIIDHGAIRHEGPTKDLLENEEIKKRYLLA
ncbi:MAG: ABC transporter ATP-binding protein [Deltaproteobacteria bacterium]|nr:ABC transporter ATP-binding protein [Deltaproteobacteria bacterium]